MGAGRILPNTSTSQESATATTITASTPLAATSNGHHHHLHDYDSGVNSDDGMGEGSSGGGGGNKKLMKRAANRRSAQLSRKRKKQFIEELKEENDDLKRKEQILRAIPDLVVVFDSSGKLRFVSESVGRFIDMNADDLIGTSFWDRLCEDSVRLLKAAFMDSLAARQADSDTAPLGSGVWELRLVDKNSNFLIVSLNGVVHFKGDVPECVCCIRPQDGPVQKVGGSNSSLTACKVVVATVPAAPTAAPMKQLGPQPILKATATTVFASPSVSASTVADSARPVISSSDGSRSSEGSGNEDQKDPKLRVTANPRQSFDSSSAKKNQRSDDDDDYDDDLAEEEDMDEDDDDDEDDEELAAKAAAASRKRRRVIGASGQIVNISDGDSEEAVSESGSDDGVTSN